MKKHEREVIYSSQSTDYMPDKTYSNPRYFTTPRHDVTKVFLVGDWPVIREAYEAVGVPVEQIDEAAVRRSLMGLPADVVRGDAPASLTPGAQTDRGGVEIPENWRELKWTGKADTLCLRQLASMVSDTPVLNKAQAADAIEAELMRRATVAALSAAGPDETVEVVVTGVEDERPDDGHPGEQVSGETADGETLPPVAE